MEAEDLGVSLVSQALACTVDCTEARRGVNHGRNAKFRDDGSEGRPTSGTRATPKVEHCRTPASDRRSWMSLRKESSEGIQSSGSTSMNIGSKPAQMMALTEATNVKERYGNELSLVRGEPETRSKRSHQTCGGVAHQHAGVVEAQVVRAFLLQLDHHVPRFANQRSFSDCAKNGSTSANDGSDGAWKRTIPGVLKRTFSESDQSGGRRIPERDVAARAGSPYLDVPRFGML